MAYMVEMVAKLTGATLKQLIHWDKTQLISPSISSAKGKGSRRIYSFMDVLAIKTAVMLRREGVSLQKVRRCLKYLRDHHTRNDAAPLATMHLLTDGASIFMLSENPGEACQSRHVVDTLAGGQMLLMVPIGRLASEVQREAARLDPDSMPAIELAQPTGPDKKHQREGRSTRKGVRAG